MINLLSREGAYLSSYDIPIVIDPEGFNVVATEVGDSLMLLLVKSLGVEEPKIAVLHLPKYLNLPEHAVWIDTDLYAKRH